MSLSSVTANAKRATSQAATHAIAKRGAFALVERRCRASWLLGAYAVHVTFTPAIVTSVTRDGIVKAVRIAGQDWPLKRRDWYEITVDSRGLVHNPEAVLAALVDEDGRARVFDDRKEAVAAIKAAAGIGSAAA